VEAVGGILVVMPGDEIEWEVRVRSRSKLRSVRAVFSADGEGYSRRQVLVGEVLSEPEKDVSGRTSYAVLYRVSAESHDFREGEDYRLRSVECVTWARTKVPLPNHLLPALTIRYEKEPAVEEVEIKENSLRAD